MTPMKRSEPEPSNPSAPPNLKPLIEALVARRDLTRAEAESGMRGIIAGVDPCQTSAFLLLLRAKGETPSEVAGMVSVMREHMVTVDPGGSCIDIVGTGGDGHHTVNFSTAASIVAAACGACVAKHGNRSVSSQCGSADVLEELGVVIARACANACECPRPRNVSHVPLIHLAYNLTITCVQSLLQRLSAALRKLRSPSCLRRASTRR